MYFSRSIYFDYFLMCLNGFGIAVGYNITKKNACAFFMNRKALICAIINLFSNAFSFCLIFYFEVFILNFDIEYPSIDKIYYKEKIFLNYQRIFIFEIVLSIFTCLITLLLYFKNDVNETIKFGFNSKLEKKTSKKIEYYAEDTTSVNSQPVSYNNPNFASGFNIKSKKKEDIYRNSNLYIIQNIISLIVTLIHILN